LGDDADKIVSEAPVVDYMEQYRVERDRLLAEIERNRTAEQRAEAAEIRARRLAYERLSGPLPA
jgi:hypothetical protein